MDLVRQLLDARDARELGRLQRRLLTLDVLIIDDLGFVPFDSSTGSCIAPTRWRSPARPDAGARRSGGGHRLRLGRGRCQTYGHPGRVHRSLQNR